MIRTPHRNTVRAKKVREELLRQLGGACALCAEADPEKLEFDHINGRDYTANRLSYLQRMNRYVAEAARGELRILCGRCNLAVRKTYENGAHCPTNYTPARTLEIPEIVEVEL